MSEPVLALPNIAAEEGDGWRELSATPAVATAAGLWRLLFSRHARLQTEPASQAAWWPDDLGPEPDEPAFDWIPTTRCLVPWLATTEAQQLADAAQLPLAGPSPQSVATVHDKSFALSFAQAEGYEPRPLRGLCR